MHHTRNKKELARRVGIYIFMTLSVVVAVGASLFWVLGYTIDEKTGRSERGGLVQFRSFPENAKVTIDGGALSSQTPTKSNQRAGYHSVTMSKEGYRNWTKSKTLRPGELLWMNALLVPSSIKTSQLHEFTELTGTLASPDKKWVAATTVPSQARVTLVDLRDEEKTKVEELTLQNAGIDTASPEDVYTVREWDFGSRYLLVTHTKKDGMTQWLRVDRTDPKNTINISKMFGMSITDIHFSGTSGTVLYGLTDGTLRKFDIGQKVVSSPIGTNVTSFQLYKEDVLAFVSQVDAVWSVYYAKGSSDAARKVVSYRDGQPTIAAVTDYYNETYLAIARNQTVRIILSPQEKDARRDVATLSTQHPVNSLLFSNNGQFLVAYSGDKITSYDLERQEQFAFDIPGATAAAPITRPLKWLDDFHIWTDVSGKLLLVEFDGANREEITSVAPGGTVTLSSNGKRLVSVGLNAQGKKVLQASRMVIE